MDRKARVSSLRWYAVYKILFGGFKVISSLTTRSRQKNLAKNMTQILLFISCSTCHVLEIAGRIFTDGMWLKSRDSWLSISVKIMCGNYIIYRENIN